MSLICLAAVLALAAAEPAAVTSSNGSAGTAPPPKTAQADPNAMVCKSIMTTGTRFPTKECRTRAQWDQLAADSRDMTQDTQRAMGIPH